MNNSYETNEKKVPKMWELSQSNENTINRFRKDTIKYRSVLETKRITKIIILDNYLHTIPIESV